MIPFTPHLAFECLELFNCRTVNIWPKVDSKNIINEVKLAVQINGKTRGTIETEPNSNEKDTIEKVKATKVWEKYLSDDIEVKKVIYIQNKIIFSEHVF